jgi:hypothetical protein
LSCTVCRSNVKAQVEEAMRNLGVREVSRIFPAFSKSTLHRHRLHMLKPEASAPPPPLEPQVRLKQHRARLERLLEKAERASDYRAGTALLGQLAEIDKRILDRRPEKHGGRGGVCNCPNPRIKVVLDNPFPEGHGHSSMEVLEYVGFAIRHIGWQPILQEVLERMSGTAGLSEAVKQAAKEFLAVLIVERDRADTNGDR